MLNKVKAIFGYKGKQKVINIHQGDNMKDSEKLLAMSTLIDLYLLSEKNDTHIYPTSTVLHVGVGSEIVTITVPNKVLDTIKEEL